MLGKNYNIESIAINVNGKLVSNAEISNLNKIEFDSRKIINPANTLFIALKSSTNDGHLFLVDAYNKGIRNFLISDKSLTTNLKDSNIIIVEDTLVALHQFAIKHRNSFHIPIIGITGSNGKTIVKEWLSQILFEKFNIVKNPKSFNSQIGVPISILQINSNHNLGIFEAGISKPNEMEQLAKIIQPSIGIFTNIGNAHNEGFRDINEKISEKLKLFKNAEVLIYCKDYTEIDNQIDSTQKTFTWSKNADADIKISNITVKQNNSEVSLIYDKQSQTFNIPFTDKGSIENCIHCITTAYYLGLSSIDINKIIQNLKSISMRLDIKAGINDCLIINDSYNSDLESFSIALDFLDSKKTKQSKTIILSDILQSGMTEQALYTSVSKSLKQGGISRFIGIGKNILTIRDILEKDFNNIAFFETTVDFIQQFDSNQFKNEAILLKGARPFHFEKISKLLSQKKHDTILEINLSAIAHNLKIYQSLLKANTKIMGMVKAFSYGSGSYEVAKVLQYNNISFLAVAYLDEGIALREANITTPIMVMNAQSYDFEWYQKYKLEPEIYDLEILSQWAKKVKQSKIGLNIHIKIDSGMHRLGFSLDEIPPLINILKTNKQLNVVSAFSHLASSDEIQHKEFTLEQIKIFKEACTLISDGLSINFLKHILNSAGIINFSSAQMDMVRLGLGLYGIDITKQKQKKLQNVSTLKTTIAQIKEIKTNETIGYNRSALTKTKTIIAIVKIGYADGISRLLGNKNFSMKINGKQAPIIGKVCMDMCMLDITKIPEAKTGSEVIIFDDANTIKKIAEQSKTIPYEVLTNISDRVKRVYYED